MQTSCVGLGMSEGCLCDAEEGSLGSGQREEEG